jgi:hypothetical protein
VLGLSGQNSFDAFNQSTGAIDTLFDSAVNFVRVAAAFVVATDQVLGIGGRPYLAAYNSTTLSAATRTGTHEWDIAGDACLRNNFCSSGWDLLSLSSAGNDIQAIRRSGFVNAGSGVSRLAMFDTLGCDRAGRGGDGTVPEPSRVLLTGMAVVALWGSRHRGAKRA